SKAGDHFCPNGYELEVDLTTRSHQDERLIASAVDGRMPDQCNWRLTFKSLPAPKRLVLQGLSGESGTGMEMRYQLHSRDMLSFRGSCYAISAIHQSLPAFISGIGGAAQLASFSSLAEISEFVAANAAREKKYPFTRPLNLNQKIRFGLFHRPVNSSVYYLTKTVSDCLLQPVLNSKEFIASSNQGLCGTLRLNSSGKVVAEFDNCSQPMLSLISFPETPASRKDCNGQCSEEVLKFIRDKSQVGHLERKGNKFPLVLGISLGIFATLAIGAVLYLPTRTGRKKPPCKNPNHASLLLETVDAGREANSSDSNCVSNSVEDHASQFP
uniref:CUB domain-containing protein n=1 Tax=Macrostomum lignano TaxID=282301 RepID=A0A1I8GAD4_9PLAT